MSALPHRMRRAGFTLVELMVAMVVFLIITGVVFQLIEQTSRIWRNSNSRIQTFQEARAGFDAMTRMMSQATLNTYYDYYNAGNQPRTSMMTPAALTSFVPATYDRVSDLHFISGQAATLLQGAPAAIVTQTQAAFFQAPRGYSVAYQSLDNALNACGYFLQFDDGAAMVPDFIKTSPGYKHRYRFRLMEMVQGTEDLGIYFDPAQASPPGPNDWFVKYAGANSRVIAENVIALVILPRLADRQDDPAKSGQGVSIAPNYNYNSRIGLKANGDPSWPSANPPFPGDTFTTYPSSGVAVTSSRHAQLPPMMKVLMVVIDEASAAKIQGDLTKPPVAIDLSKTTLFTDATKFTADLQTLENICTAKSGNLTGNTIPLSYQVFTSDIILHQSKWSNK